MSTDVLDIRTAPEAPANLISALRPASPVDHAPDLDCELTILMPCLNEAKTIARCIRKARAFLARTGIRGEILIGDNGSSDGSQEVAIANGAHVVDVPLPGYGNALIGGIRAAHGKYIIMGDSDDSYDFGALEPFVEKLRAGYQLVMGNRFRGGIRPGAMPPLHRYLGNPVLSTIGRLFFGTPCRDFHCGLRGFDREAILGLDLQAPGMEFASEMVVKATLNKLRIAEVPTTLSPDGRGRPPHLRSWSDGWRHLRFLLLFSPRWLFLYPGLAMLVAGSLLTLWLLPGPRTIGSVTFDVHTLLYASLTLVVGFQSILFWMFATIYGMSEGMVPPDPWLVSLASIATLERGLKTAGVLLLIGLALGIYALGYWDAGGFGMLRPSETMRLVIPSSTAILLAFECANGAFFVSVLEIRATRSKPDDASRHSAGGSETSL
ncbi:MAG TPA: glycosyltransferase family 2 protein [Stellaceae bacterium]|nr:glycosyltransferase family 2 protein [Stellaceae bacterium]